MSTPYTLGTTYPGADVSPSVDRSHKGLGAAAASELSLRKQAWTREMERAQIANWFQPFAPVVARVHPGLAHTPVGTGSQTRDHVANPYGGEARTHDESPDRASEASALSAAAGHGSWTSSSFNAVAMSGAGGDSTGHAPTAGLASLADGAGQASPRALAMDHVAARTPTANTAAEFAASEGRPHGAFTGGSAGGLGGAAERAGQHPVGMSDRSAGTNTERSPTQPQAQLPAVAARAVPASSLSISQMSLEALSVTQLLASAFPVGVSSAVASAQPALPATPPVRSSKALDASTQAGLWLPVSATQSQAAAPRVHSEWSEHGLQLWIGIDGTAEQIESQVAAILPQLERSLQAQGERLHRVICNGRVLLDASRPRSTALAVDFATQFEHFEALNPITSSTTPKEDS